jgi:GNAT superfamily N-acetyltransferase
MNPKYSSVISYLKHSFQQNNMGKKMIIRGIKSSIQYHKTRAGDWHIVKVYVHPCMRGQGIAKEMLHRLKLKAKAQGIKKIFLVASSAAYGTPLKILLHLYKSTGFRQANKIYKMVCKIK